MNVVDSSGWLEYLGAGPNAGKFAPAIESTATLIVPSICRYEVFKKACLLRSRLDALVTVSMMRNGIIAEVTESIALTAAELSIKHSLPMADSLILATAQTHDAELWTMDADFENILGVRYFRKK